MGRQKKRANRKAISDEAIAEKRAHIRAAAIRIFAEKGYHGATISQIARAADVGKGTVYLYFSNKEDLLIAILEHHFDGVMSLIEKAEQAEMAKGDPARAIRAVIGDAAHRLEEDPSLFRVMEQQPLLYHERVKERFEGLFREMVGRTEAILRGGIEQGVVRPCDPRIVASILLSTAVSFPMYLTLYPEDEHGPLLNRLTGELSELIWMALRPQGAAQANANSLAN